MFKKIIKKYPASKKILLIAAVGAFIAGTLVFPQLPRLLKGKELDLENFLDENEWDGFDERRLRQRLKEMHKNKLISIYQAGDKIAVNITQKGKRQLLKYKLEDMKIPQPKEWDKKWRIVLYDIPKEKNDARDALRRMLKKLGFLELQKSAYLYPYPCEDAVDFLREVYGVGEHVTLLTIGYLENEDAYKDYFAL